jgi:quercetin dioxygenase-like cupin family protein
MHSERVRILPQALGEKVDLGKGSSSNLILTGSHLQNENRNMMGYTVYKPGIDTKQKIHLEAEELAYVLTGSGKLTIGKELVAFTAGDSIFIPPGVPHGVRNDGTQDVAMVFFFSSPEYPKTVDA